MKWRRFFSGEARSRKQAAVSLPDTLGVQLWCVNSHKTSLCSQKMRAGRVWPCTYTWSHQKAEGITLLYCTMPQLSLPPMFLVTNRPRGPCGYTVRLYTNAKKLAVNQQQSKKKVQTCMCRYINGNLNVRFPSCLNAQFDICFKKMCDVLRNGKTAAFIIEIKRGAAKQGILKYWLRWWH